MRSARIGSKSARWQTTSSVLHFPAIGRAIAADPVPPRRSVVIALWDAEEDGLLGSQAYVANPVVPLAQTRTDLVGSGGEIIGERIGIATVAYRRG